MLIKSRAIVLNSLKLGESQVIVDFLTETQGRMSFVQRVPRSARGRMRTRLFQPLTLLQVEIDFRPNRRLQTLRDATIDIPFQSIPFDARKLAIALFVAEFTTYTTRREQANVPLFDYIYNSVMWLDTCTSDFANFHIIYMLRLSRFAGFYPNLESASEGACFDLRSGCFSAHTPLHRDYIGAEEARKIGLLMRVSYATMHLITMSREERNRCVEVIVHYYRLHEPDFPELKSLPVLRELFV